MDSPLTNSKLSNDDTLQQISRHFIRAPSDLRIDHNKFLQEYKLLFLQKLKEADPDFAKCNPHIIACGSYFKKTKVGKPDEYDLNLVLNLPFDYSKCQFSTNKLLPGFVKIDVREAFTEKWRQTRIIKKDSPKQISKNETKKSTPSVFHNYNGNRNRQRTSLEKKLVDQKSGCLDQEKLRRWIESLVTKSEMLSRRFSVGHNTYDVQFRKCGPAQTAGVSINGREIMTIDFVPCLQFEKNLNGFYKNGVTGTMKWLAVPKLYKFPESQNVLPVDTNLFWRTSFYAYEAEILRRKNNYGAVNEVIRFMKKLKSKYQWDSKLPSYYLETLFFHEIEVKKTSFDRRSRTQIFVHMLHVLKDALENGTIKFFWNKNFNLLENHKRDTLQNLKGKVSNIIDTIYKNINNYNNVLADILLTKEEYAIFIRPDFAHKQEVEALTDRADAESASSCVLS